jgi:imidazolonepropionase-like amidohydrolase
MMHRLLQAVLVLLVCTSMVRAEEAIIRAATVHTGVGAPLTPGAVRVKDGKIAEVAASIAAGPGVKVVELDKGVLMPGMVDAFTSIGVEGGLAESTLEVTPNIRVLDAVDWSARAFRRARASGVTTVGIVPGSDNVIAGLSCIVKTAGERAIRIVKTDHALVLTLATDPASGNSSRNRPDSIYTRQPTNRMGVVWILRSEFGRAKSGSSAKEQAVLREALAGKRPILCVSRSDSDLIAALRLKQEYALPLTLAGAQEAYKVRNDLSAAGTPLLLGPLSATAGPGPDQSETILNLPGTLHEAGIPFALTGGNLLDQARIAVRFGLSKDAALAAITVQPAKLLGQERRLGAIAVGRDADIVALTGDPFDLTSSIRWTMIDGVMRAEER